jgi:hypothetical protein
MRCKACNVGLDSVEMSRDEEYNGMCRKCVGKSNPVYIYTRDKEYAHEKLTESLNISDCNNFITNNLDND